MSDRPLIVVNPSTVRLHVAYNNDDNGGSIEGAGITVSSPSSTLEVGFFITADETTDSNDISKISYHLSEIGKILTPTGGE